MNNKKLMVSIEVHANGDEEKLLSQVQRYSDKGADGIYITEYSISDEEHDDNIGLIKKINRLVSVPLYIGGNIKRVEDVKKYLYAGAEKAVLDFAKDSNIKLLEAVYSRFGKEKLAVRLPEASLYRAHKNQLDEMVSELICGGEEHPDATLPMILDGAAISESELVKTIAANGISGICGGFLNENTAEYMELKQRCKEAGIAVYVLESSLDFSVFKLNDDGMLPVIVQDYKTGEVLMLAYMNEEAYEYTIKTGKMTYYSRSRQELWVKGLTSGHFQYVKSLTIDCDKDTILAKVGQIGAACHTGNPSCFFTPLAGKDEDEHNPLHVFENVYQTIEDRKKYPKEGSYTNYLFDKGIDKILKKVGEEATEIIIAAKNPDPEEIKYEIADFLYHTMVLMAEKGVDWTDIIDELANRE